MLQVEYNSLIDSLKAVLKGRGLSYAELASVLSTSEVTIKRVLSPKTGQYSPRFFEILEHLDISLFDLVDLAKGKSGRKFWLSSEQEKYFLKHLAHFAIFREVYRKRSLVSIRDRFGLSKKELFKILLGLEKINLVEVMPGDLVRVVPCGTLELKLNSPLEMKMRRELTGPFLEEFYNLEIIGDSKSFLNSEIEMSKQCYKDFQKELKEIERKYCQLSFRDKSLLPADQLLSIRWLLASGNYTTSR